jgi:hypothetical protein
MWQCLQSAPAPTTTTTHVPACCLTCSAPSAAASTTRADPVEASRGLWAVPAAPSASTTTCGRGGGEWVRERGGGENGSVWEKMGQWGCACCLLSLNHHLCRYEGGGVGEGGDGGQVSQGDKGACGLCLQLPQPSTSTCGVGGWGEWGWGRGVGGQVSCGEGGVSVSGPRTNACKMDSRTTGLPAAVTTARTALHSLCLVLLLLLLLPPPPPSLLLPLLLLLQLLLLWHKLAAHRMEPCSPQSGWCHPPSARTGVAGVHCS